MYGYELWLKIKDTLHIYKTDYMMSLTFYTLTSERSQNIEEGKLELC